MKEGKVARRQRELKVLRKSSKIVVSAQRSLGSHYDGVSKRDSIPLSHASSSAAGDSSETGTTSGGGIAGFRFGKKQKKRTYNMSQYEVSNAEMEKICFETVMRVK